MFRLSPSRAATLRTAALRALALRTVGVAFATASIAAAVAVAGCPEKLAAQEPGRQSPGAVAFVGANVIDPATGRVVRDATVFVSAGRISRIAEGRGPIPADDVRVVDLRGRYLVPGLIDAHVHIGSFEAARLALHSGVTTARSMGVNHFSDVGLRELAKRGAIESPEIVASGYHVRPRPADGLFQDEPSLADLLDTGVHGADAIRRVTAVMLAHDVDVIKVNATERAGLPETDPRKPFYDEYELGALVELASGAGVPVAAHAHGDTGGRAAVLAGVRSVEHGTYLSEETLGLMADRGTYLVPTIAVVADLTVPGGDYDIAALQVRGRHMLPRVREMAAAAHRLGVPIVAATDTGYGSQSVLRLSHELIELVGVGLSPLEAMRAATTTAAELLDVADHTGRIAEGLDADLLVLERNPLDDIGAYQDVLLVMNDGQIVLNRLDW
jgi:imidazolonepropionase-like amidohydrolase